MSQPYRRGLVAFATALSLCLAAAPHRPARAGRSRIVAVRGGQARPVAATPKPPPVFAPKGRLGSVLAAARAASARPVARFARDARSIAVAFAIAGPRHTWASIKKNPILFSTGAVAIGALGAVAAAVGVPMLGTLGALAISTAGLAVQIGTALPAIRHARGVGRWRLIARDIAWPVALYAGTFGLAHVGAGLLGLDHGGVTHGPASPPGPSDLVIAGIESATIGSDAPAIGVTALESLRGGPVNAENAPQRKPRNPVAWLRGTRAARSRARRRRRTRRRQPGGRPL